MHSKIVFLDIDGVLNTDAFRIQANRAARELGKLDPATHLDPDLIQKLNLLISATGAGICLSTSWRVLFGFEETVRMLTQRGMVAKAVGQTPKLYGPRFSSPPPPRGDEIRSWLGDNPSKSFVILDDEKHAGKGHGKRFIHVKDGLEDVHIERAVKILNDEVEA